MSSPALLDVLACPRCARALVRRDGAYRCPACKVDFPDWAGLPWLFCEPNASRDEWRQRFQFLLRRLEHEGADLGRSLERGDLLPATRKRLEQLLAAKRDHAQRLAALLAPLLETEPAARYEMYLALRTRLPPEQGIATYYANVARDWCWGEAENQAALGLVLESVGASRSGVTVVLGAGAGRLAYDLHLAGTGELTLALDFNPFLMLLAERLSRGEVLELYEFPLAPRSLDDLAPLRRLAAPAPADAGLVFVIADALRAPMLPGRIDRIVTPWLVDIVAEDFARLAARINRWLRPGGCWVNFGSLSFHDADPALRYSLDECLELVTKSGFGTPTYREAVLPYLCSPASRHGRREEIVLWSAQKKREAPHPTRPEALPEWLVHGNLPVPALPEFQHQALATRIHAFLMAQIDGRRSLREIARALVDQGLMSAQEAEPALRSFLTKMLDDSRRPVTH